jgi:DNA-binding transcriptional MerR regulator
LREAGSERDEVEDEEMKTLEWLPISEVVEKTAISDPTIRRYIRYHSRFVKTAKQGNVTVIATESIPTLIKIRRYYDAGWNRERVEKALQDTEPMAIVVHSDNHTDTTLGEYLSDLKKVIHMMAEQQKQLESEVQALREQLKERDAAIIEMLSRVETYSRRHKSIFSRWFGKGD